MALCLRVPMQLPNKLKYQFQCCTYLTWNRIRNMKKKVREKYSSHMGIRNLRLFSKKQDNHIEKYFDDLGKKVSGPYLNLLKGLTQDIPELPAEWNFNSGWTRYSSSGSSPVDIPEEDALVFDVEVCVQEGFYPTLAAAVSQKAWYLWVSPRLIKQEKARDSILTPNDLIPLGISRSPRIVVGHFISYDRARIRENYSLLDSGVRFFDTLSAHMCISGVTNVQRNIMFSSSYNNEEWRQLSCPNSLEKISEFYCGVPLNKTNRDIFVTGTLEEISKDFQTLSTYCAEDVIATHKVLCKLLPLFIDRQPHPLSLAGMLELSGSFFPVDKFWGEELEKLNSTARELKETQCTLMKTRADKCLPLSENEGYKQDPWMWDQDWKLVQKQGNAYPSWYKAFCLGCAKSLQEFVGTSIVYAGLTVPKILRLRCGSYPLHYINRLGWGVIVPRDQFVGDVTAYLEDEVPPIPLEEITKLCSEAIVTDFSPSKKPTVSSIMELTENDLYWRESSSSSPRTTEPEESPSADTIHELLISDTLVFRRLLNVGGMRPVKNPLGIIMSKSLTSFNSLEEEGKEFLEIRDKLSSWLSYGSQWKTQNVVWLNDEEFGIVLPMLVMCGDYLRLPREKAWPFLLSLEDHQLGADLLKCVRAPQNYKFLTATIDNLDLWLAALVSDAVEGSLGSTLFGLLLTSGILFDEMAAVLDTNPEEAKCLCLAVIAGADTYTLSKLIFQTHVNISKDEAFQRACACMDLLLEFKLVSASPSVLWPNIQADEVRTPMLGARMSRPLELEKNRVRLRAQWMIHSSKVDFLHSLVACYRTLQPDVRLSFANGDSMSLYFLVKLSEAGAAEESLKAAYAKVQSFCVSRLGLTFNHESYCPSLKISCSDNLGA